jgi:hypothetical protein
LSCRRSTWEGLNRSHFWSPRLGSRIRNIFFLFMFRFVILKETSNIIPTGDNAQSNHPLLNQLHTSIHINQVSTFSLYLRCDYPLPLPPSHLPPMRYLRSELSGPRVQTGTYSLSWSPTLLAYPPTPMSPHTIRLLSCH